MKTVQGWFVMGFFAMILVAGYCLAGPLTHDQMIEDLRNQYAAANGRLTISFSFLVQAKRAVSEPEIRRYFVSSAGLADQLATITNFFASEGFDDPAASLAVLQVSLNQNTESVCHKRANHVDLGLKCEQWDRKTVLAMALLLHIMKKTTEEFKKDYATLSKPEDKFKRLKAATTSKIILGEAVKTEQGNLLAEIARPDVLRDITQRDQASANEMEAWLSRSDVLASRTFKTLQLMPPTSASVRIGDETVVSKDFGLLYEKLRSQPIPFGGSKYSSIGKVVIADEMAKANSSDSKALTSLKASIAKRAF